MNGYYWLVETGIPEGDRLVKRVNSTLIPCARHSRIRHRRILDRLAGALSDQDRTGPDFRMARGPDLPVWPPDVRTPDLVLFPLGAFWLRPGVNVAAHMFLVIGAAKCPSSHELGFNAGLYRRAGVREYWVVDVGDRCLRVFRLAGTAYRQKRVWHGRIGPSTLPGVEVDVDALFGSE